MSFAAELSTLMNANAEINSLVDGIYRETTSTEFNANKNWVIYTFKQNNSISVIGNKDAISVFTLYVEVYTDQASETGAISEMLKTYLTGFTSDSIRDISFNTETHSNIADTNEQVAYITLMEFEVLYQNG